MILRSKITGYMDTFVLMEHWEGSAWLWKLSIRNLLEFSEGLAEHLMKGDS